MYVSRFSDEREFFTPTSQKRLHDGAGCWSRSGSVRRHEINFGTQIALWIFKYHLSLFLLCVRTACDELNYNRIFYSLLFSPSRKKISFSQVSASTRFEISIYTLKLFIEDSAAGAIKAFSTFSSSKSPQGVHYIAEKQFRHRQPAA